MRGRTTAALVVALIGAGMAFVPRTSAAATQGARFAHAEFSGGTTVDVFESFGPWGRAAEARVEHSSGCVTSDALEPEDIAYDPSLTYVRVTFDAYDPCFGAVVSWAVEWHGQGSTAAGATVPDPATGASGGTTRVRQARAALTLYGGPFPLPILSEGDFGSSTSASLSDVTVVEGVPLPGPGGGECEPVAIVDTGTIFYVVIDDPAGGLPATWIYLESNGQAGLQRNDPRCRESSVPDTLVAPPPD